MVFDERLGIILGSLLSGVMGYIVLHLTLPKNEA
jgi:NhaA family Na+:H+ antiporter